MLIILAIVLLILLPWPWSIVGFVVVTVLWVGELFLWNRSMRGRSKKTGPQTLVGKHGTIVSASRPAGQVRVEGEIWAARCEGGASIGDTVHVVAVDGLTLVVEVAA